MNALSTIIAILSLLSQSTLSAEGLAKNYTFLDKGMKHSYSLSLDDLLKSPKYKLSKSKNPPVDLNQAQQIARKHLSRFVSDDSKYKVISITLRTGFRMKNRTIDTPDHCYWVVVFDNHTVPVERFAHLKSTVIVLMNGESPKYIKAKM